MHMVNSSSSLLPPLSFIPCIIDLCVEHYHVNTSYSFFLLLLVSFPSPLRNLADETLWMPVSHHSCSS